MPATSTKYDNKFWKYVPVVVGGVTFSYAFKTNVDASTFGTLLGHADVTTSATNLIVGANYPKPARASGIKNSKYGSSYIAPSAYAAAKLENFNITPSKRGPIAVGTAGADSKAMVITLAGIDYAWNMSDDTHGALPTDIKTALKISEVTTPAQAKKAVVAASFPKPARWSVKLDEKRLTTFGDDDAAITIAAPVLGVRKTKPAIIDPTIYGLAAAAGGP